MNRVWNGCELQGRLRLSHRHFWRLIHDKDAILLVGGFLITVMSHELCDITNHWQLNSFLNIVLVNNIQNIQAPHYLHFVRVNSGFPSQRASNVESIISSRHHVLWSKILYYTVEHVVKVKRLKQLKKKYGNCTHLQLSMKFIFTGDCNVMQCLGNNFLT